MYVNNNRGAGNAGQGGGNFRNHTRGGFGNRDNRRGGSFNAGAYQQGASFRGGRHNRSGRNDTANAAARDPDASSKKEEPKRTVTDFSLVGLEIQELHWSWGVLSVPSAKTESQEELVSTDLVKSEAEDSVALTENDAPSVPAADVTVKTESGDSAPSVTHSSEVTSVAPDAPAADSDASSPLSRVRIYFHTAVTAEDAVPIPHASALPVDASSFSSSLSKKGKRKRAEDEEEDVDLESINHPEPSADGDAMSTAGATDMDGVGRGSAAPSVTETASDGGDWLMAAIAEDDGDGDASESDPHEIHQGDQNLDGEYIS